MPWFVLLACQEPFDADRHDLLGFRVAAVSASPAAPGDPVDVEAAVVVDDRPWSEIPVTLAWEWVDDPESRPATFDDGTGPEPALVRPPDHPGWLALLAERGEATRRAVVRVPNDDVTPVSLAPLELAGLPWSVADVEADPLKLDARRDTPTEPTADRTVAPGGFVRVALTQAPARDGTVRWMATGGGSFFELDPLTTDWAAGDLRLDDDEVEGSREAVPPGPVTVLALWLSADDPATAFRATDFWVGPVPDGVFTRGRFLPSTALAPGALLQGTLEADPDSPLGVRLVDPTALADPPAAWSSAMLGCAVPTDGPFEPRWLLTQRCTVSDLDGRTVEIEVDP
ncbi:MAG: hypothetical protein AAF211_07975 [Myxococcota bacterium]